MDASNLPARQVRHFKLRVQGADHFFHKYRRAFTVDLRKEDIRDSTEEMFY